MKTLIEIKFFENEESLAQTFSFEKLGTQLHLLSSCPEDFRIVPTDSIQRRSKLMFKKLTDQSNMSDSLINTMLYTQARLVINDYMSLIS